MYPTANARNYVESAYVKSALPPTSAPPSRHTLAVALNEQHEYLLQLVTELNELESRISSLLDPAPVSGDNAKETHEPRGPLDIVDRHNARIMMLSQRLRDLTSRVHL